MNNAHLLPVLIKQHTTFHGLSSHLPDMGRSSEGPDHDLVDPQVRSASPFHVNVR